MSDPVQRTERPVVPVVLALALAGSNWLVHMLSFTPAQISGNGFTPEQLLMTIASEGLALALLVSVFRYADRVAPRLARRARWFACLALLVAGAVLLTWAWSRFREYEGILHYFRGGAQRSSVVNQFTVRFWAADVPFWAGLLSLAGSGGLLRGRVPVVFLMVPLGLALVLPAVLVPSGYRINSRGELVMLRPGLPVFLVEPGSGRPAFYLVQSYNHELLALSVTDPASGCTVVWHGGLQGFEDLCKGAEYDDSGRVPRGAVGKSLARYPVRAEGDRLYIDLAGPR